MVCKKRTGKSSNRLIMVIQITGSKQRSDDMWLGRVQEGEREREEVEESNRKIGKHTACMTGGKLVVWWKSEIMMKNGYGV